MKVTEFSSETKTDHISPQWEKFMDKNDFISYMPSYKGSVILDEFEEYKHPAEDVGEITYYMFNPCKNNQQTEKKFPLLIFIHGATNSFDGKVCVAHSGGEMFATEKYQKAMGNGAFVLVPLANEKKDKDGMLCDSWKEEYLPHLKDIIQNVIKKYPVSKVIIGGGSSGGYMTWKMAVKYPELFDACFPVSSEFMPSVDELKMLEKYNVNVLYACGKHDEFGCFNEDNMEIYDYIAKMKNGICYTPEWTRNGDHGIASLYFGIEMGQHCMITQVQANLMFDDGTPYCDLLPDGVTGWIRDIANS